ncbi:hypothetical protein AMTR_s00034p00232700 [Amborella trichopoda]|uniref:Uncharacterized protein n=1 Tax=Amborella trichopoda TaxID=13333 RepID=W1PQG1_AMBTC|nr:hypothetical protein AMTR_s00034p00232700 [Amborella trichopoda]
MLSINWDKTPLQNQDQENPDKSKQGVIIVASNDLQEVNHPTKSGSQLNPLRVMDDTMEEGHDNPLKADQNPIGSVEKA